MPDYTFHLIPNAHLDPVWLWDWREGLNEGLVTCWTILDLMDEDKDLTFIRGESIIYQHIEQNDPATFKRIARYIKAGRWDVVGGTVSHRDVRVSAFVSDPSAQRNAVRDFAEDAYGSGVSAVLRVHRSFWGCSAPLADFAGWVVDPDGAVGWLQAKQGIDFA